MTPRSFTILIVSPDRVSLRRLSKFLDVFGYDVRQATDAEKALAAAEAARLTFSSWTAAAASRPICSCAARFAASCRKAIRTACCFPSGPRWATSPRLWKPDLMIF